MKIEKAKPGLEIIGGFPLIHLISKGYYSTNLKIKNAKASLNLGFFCYGKLIGIGIGIAKLRERERIGNGGTATSQRHVLSTIPGDNAPLPCAPILFVLS